jgi:hypothetical protein
MVAMMSNTDPTADFDLSTVEGQEDFCWEQHRQAQASVAAAAALEAQLETRAYRSARADAARLRLAYNRTQLWRVLRRICNTDVATFDSTGRWVSVN